MACGNSQYMPWLRVGLGLKYLALGLEEFVTKQIKNSHKELLNNVAMSMSLSSVSDIDCSGQTLIKSRRAFKPQVFHCDIHITGDINMCVSKQCPNASCHKLINEITKLHRQHRPIWSNTNINPCQWICDPWEFAKCFLSFSGNLHINSISDVDAAGILGIMINLLPIAMSLKIEDKDIRAESDVLSKCRHARNAIMHSSSLDEYTMRKYLDLMTDVLKCIPCLPASRCIIDALDSIDQLKNGKLPITEKEKTEIQAGANLAYRQTRLNGWRNEQEYFVSTRASSETMKLLKTSPLVVVTGISGSGKSFLVRNTALNLQDRGYEIHMVDKPSQIFKNHQMEKNMVFILDDPFGKCTIDHQKVNKWNDNEDKLKYILGLQENPFQNETKQELTNSENISLGKTIILISCRLNIYKNHYISKLSKALKFQECDLSSGDLCLTLSEKQEMFAKYIDNLTFDKVKCDMDYFPLVCMLSLHKEQDVVKKIFENPPKRIRDEIENMKHDDTLQFCCLCHCVMFDQGFNLNWLRMWDVDDYHQEHIKQTTNIPSDDDYTDSDSETSLKNKGLNMSDLDDKYQKQMEQIFDDDSDSDDDMLGAYHKDPKRVIHYIFKEFQCDVNSEQMRCKLLKAFCTLTGTYCKEVGDIVVFRHDKILDIAAKICGEILLSTYISHASTKFIAKRYTLHDSPQVVTNEYLIHIPTSHEQKYFSRIFEDLTNNQTESFAFNDQLENENFQNKLMQYVEIHNKQELIKTTLRNHSVTIERSLSDIKVGFKTYSEFLFKLGVNKDNVLVCVCESGNSEALEYLLTSCGINVNSERTYKYSYPYINTPLLAAVQHGDVHNVRLLLQFKADVNIGDNDLNTPLMRAALNNKKQILKLLLENNASVTQCDKLGRTALHLCCCFGAGEIEECVKLLLQYKSDVMQCDNEGKTALHYCCMFSGGDIECVKLLLQYKSDVMQCDKYGMTALHMCCIHDFGEGVREEYVKLLLQYNSDVMHRDKVGMTPVDWAKQNGLTNVVHILQQHSTLLL